MSKRPGDRRVVNRRRYPSKKSYPTAIDKWGKIFGISKIMDQQSGALEDLYHRRDTGQVTTNTRIGSERRFGPADRRTGPIDRRSGEDRRKEQIGKVFHHKFVGEPEFTTIKMSAKEYANSKIPKERIIGTDPNGDVFIYDLRKNKERRQTKGRRATDK